MAHTLPLVLMASMLSLAQSFWGLGQISETCSDACLRLGGVCDDDDFSKNKPKTKEEVEQIGATIVDGGCDSFYPIPSMGPLMGIPNLLISSKLCQYATPGLNRDTMEMTGPIDDPKCDTQSAKAYQRFCFCTATTTTTTTSTTTTTITTTTSTVTTLAGSQFLQNQQETEETDNVKDALIAAAVTFAAGLCCILFTFICLRWVSQQNAKHIGDSEVKSEEGEKDKTSIHADDTPPGMLLGQEVIGAQNKQEENVTESMDITV